MTKTYTMTPYLNALKEISEKARREIGQASITFLQSHGTGQDQEQCKALWMAALDGMADLIQYGELGPAAIHRLHRAREGLGIPMEVEPD